MTWTLVSAGGGYLLFVTLLFAAQRALMYHPDPRAPDLQAVAAAGYHAVVSETGNGLSLRHIFRPPRTPAAPVIVYFHGNGGRAAGRIGKLDPALRGDEGLLLVEYRGYGGNPGRPSEQGLLADGRSVLEWLEQEGIAAHRLVFYGESLGSGVAVPLAAELAAAGRPVGAVVLEAPFSSMFEAAQVHFWYAPARLLVRDRYDNLAHVGAIGAPLLVIHGDRDRTVPLKLGRRLYEAASHPKQFLEVAGAGHANVLSFEAAAGALKRFLAELQATR